ncbi:DNA-directed RNA polymerase core subunit RPB8 [Ascoidea rubescens DSM 1968]|uniref:DNA-directed RNA polymerases I, II, and III subunit RPABC3 n=1 Tax=Ascoidea rubescens DSM 1968 TaxID=1344418 RepID=A0A1D2VK61_9ASCO|nr:RNA polymerase [Ascoidea rubescens DSM 1968]ODV61983.1 RNA polymerase [Ascoidea rubescens DSM 1968]
MSNTLFDDRFVVESTDSARYDRITRIVASSTSSKDIKITLDINSEIYPVADHDTLTITLASSLTEDPADDFANVGWRPHAAESARSLADDYEYVMYGTIYKFDESVSTNESIENSIKVYASFGGLLMCLEGTYRNLSSLKQSHVYILIRK